VEVFDSYRTGNVAFSDKETIESIQQQLDSSSCGLFSLANAYTLCEGTDLALIKYDTSKMRPHFLSCI